MTKTIDFSSKFKKANILSFIFFSLSILFIMSKGLNYGIDFKGGTLIELRTDKQNIKIPFLCMSKGAGRNSGLEDYHIIQDNEYHHFNLPKNSAISYYLQNLRDEAHRFAIGTHVAKRKKSMFKSGLDEIPNVGAARKKLLLNHFGDLNSIKEASLEDLKRVKNLGNKVAKQIFDFNIMSKSTLK